MNEYEQTQDEADLKALREAVPAWKSQPLATRDSLSTDVVPPTWNKVGKMGVDPASLTQPSNDGTSLITIVAGFQENGSFVPKLVKVIGPPEDIP